jgi:hypothetical protein
MPQLSGSVQSVPATLRAVLLLDAGDVAEKGEIVAFRTHGIITYDAMLRVGYYGVAVGNHDFDDLPVVQSAGSVCLCLTMREGGEQPASSKARSPEGK